MFKRFKIEANDEFKEKFIDYLRSHANSVKTEFNNNKYIITGSGYFISVKMNNSDNAYYFKNDPYRLYPVFEEEIVQSKIKLEKL